MTNNAQANEQKNLENNSSLHSDNQSLVMKSHRNLIIEKK